MSRMDVFSENREKRDGLLSMGGLDLLESLNDVKDVNILKLVLLLGQIKIGK
jgi:hypothetical protein